MKYQNPTAGRATDSATDSSPVGDLPPVPDESVVHGGTESTGRPSSRLAMLQTSLDEMADDVLEKATVELGVSINAANARFALQVLEMDRRGLAGYEHGLTTAGWLREFCHLAIRQASGIVKTAWAMSHMPTVTDKALAGVVPSRSIQLLGQVRDRNPDEFPGSEAEFAEMSTHLYVGDLRREVGYWEQDVNYPRALDDVDHLDTLRHVYLRQMDNGMGEIRGELSPELYHIVDTVLLAKVNPTFLGDDDPRSPGQSRADALGDICQFYLDHNDDIVTSGGEKPHVTVTVDFEMLKGKTQRLPEIDGVAVTPETIRRITCDAGIIPMVLGSDSEALDVGRKTRTIPTAIRRAVERRDGGCAWKGCTAPLSWCDAHHIIHWADGGDTSADNLRLLCRKHHTATHDGHKPPPDT